MGSHGKFTCVSGADIKICHIYKILLLIVWMLLVHLIVCSWLKEADSILITGGAGLYHRIG